LYPLLKSSSPSPHHAKGRGLALLDSMGNLAPEEMLGCLFVQSGPYGLDTEVKGFIGIGLVAIRRIYKKVSDSAPHCLVVL
jgi:hypothetical protein